MDQDDPRFDVRVVGFHLRRGTLDREAYAAFIDSLPDDASEATESTVQFEARVAARRCDT